MTVIRKQRSKDECNRMYALFALIVLVVSVLNLAYPDPLPPTGAILDEEIPKKNEVLSSFNRDANSAKVKAWRDEVKQKCSAASTEKDMDAVKVLVKEQFSAPSKSSRKTFGTIQRCKNVVLDFGANVGDSISKIIDAGLPGCDKQNLDVTATKDASMAQPVFLHREERITAGKWNGVSKYFKERIEEVGRTYDEGGKGDRGPEDYCMYGVEGNPTFTKLLKDSEQYIMSLEPRPLSHLHIFTETVGAGKDEPTEIFLDTVNEDKNFWGSSIIANHRDVKEGAEAQDGSKKASKMVATPVQGMTLTKVMKDTLAAFAPGANAADTEGGHLFVKIDIEGGEYQLLNEGYESGILCDYVKKGNTLDILVEFHTEVLIGKNPDLRKYYKEVKQPLLDCGVKIKRLPGGWA